MMETIRGARLRREAADRYPFISARMWTQASRMAGLVGKHLEGRGSKCGRGVECWRRATSTSAAAFAIRSGLRRA